ncbi:unnamed protein product [Lymnaea stagnalis]|uniref:Uncharacterized protein n=1 Tax=Lymnaea stagnalis TaxID=6523 RepID=A0AAV2HCG9_LYMST
MSRAQCVVLLVIVSTSVCFGQIFPPSNGWAPPGGSSPGLGGLAGLFSNPFYAMMLSGQDLSKALYTSALFNGLGLGGAGGAGGGGLPGGMLFPFGLYHALN